MSSDPSLLKVSVPTILSLTTRIFTVVLAIIMARTMALYDFSIFVSLLMGAAGLGILVSSRTPSEAENPLHLPPCVDRFPLSSFATRFSRR